MRIKIHLATAGMLGALVACSATNLDYLKAGALDAPVDSSSDSASFEVPDTATDALETSIEVDTIVDVGPATPFTFDTGEEGWTSEAAYPVGVDNVTETWVGPDAGFTPDAGAEADVADAATITGPALVYTFDCPPLDSIDASAAANGAGINLKYQADAATLAPYVGKTITVTGYFIGAVANYEIFAQDTETANPSTGYGTGTWWSPSTVFKNGSATGAAISVTSPAYPGIQSSADPAGKFGLQLNCGTNVGPVTVVLTSVTFQ